MRSTSRPDDQAVGNGQRRLRVLCLIKGLGAGGAERLVVSQILTGDRRSFQYEVAYLLPWKTAMVPPLVEAGIPVRPLGVRREVDLRWSRRLRRLLLERRYDLLHVHSPYAAGVARLVVRSLDVADRPRVISTEHNIWSSYPTATRLMAETLFSLGDAWLAVSDEVRQSIPARFQGRVEVVLNGIVLDEARRVRRCRREVRQELGFGDEEVVIATVANFRRQKAYPDLLAAARAVLDRGLPVRFVAMGQGPLEAELKALHRALDLRDGFQFLGYRDDAMRVLAGCDIFALASLYEGYPLAVMEALALGLPIVATQVSGVSTAVRPGLEGLLVPPGRPDQLAAAIEELVRDDDLRRRMSVAATARGSDFDMAATTRRIEDVYRRLTA